MRGWLKTGVIAAAFLFATFIALELSLRFYLFGPTGLSPEKVGSFSLIFDSGYVQPADNLDIWYELKPDENGLFRGAPFRTNSQGLADDEYSFQKSPNTVRVAVVGSSWSMGSGVAIEDVYHSVLERELNNSSRAIRYEFINFGVEFYGLQEIVATARDKVLRYEPDLILVEITGSTPAIRWMPHDTAFVVPAPRKNTAWHPLLADRIDTVLGVSGNHPDEVSVYRDVVPKDEWGTYWAQVERAFTELEQLSSETGIPIATVWLRANVEEGDKGGKRFLARAAEHGIAAAEVNLDSFLQPGEHLLSLLVSRVEPHPNARGHELIAGELRKQLLDPNPLFAQR